MTVMDTIISHLREASGTIEQSFHDTRTEDGKLCALGVILQKEFVDTGNGAWVRSDTDIAYGAYVFTAPSEMGTHPIISALLTNSTLKDTICSANDIEHLTFSEIADRLEAYRDTLE